MSSPPSNAAAKSAQKRADMKDFLEKKRKEVVEQGPREMEVEIIEVIPPPNSLKSSGARYVVPSDPEKMLRITSGDGRTFELHIDVACSCSEWMRTLFKKEGGFLENQSKQINFPDFSGEALETAFGWVTLNYSLNGPDQSLHNSSDRIIFQFELSGDLIMEIFWVSCFLQIDPLTDACIAMIRHFLDEIPFLENMPQDIMARILQSLEPMELLKMENKPEVTKDTQKLWKDFFDRAGWNANEKRYICSWYRLLRFCDSSLGETDIDWRVEYLQRYLQNKSIHALSSDHASLEQLMQSLEAASPWILRHSIVDPDQTLGSMLPLYLSKMPHLEFLELSGINLNEDHVKVLCEYLTSHPRCTTLRLVNCGIQNFELILPLLKCQVVQALDLSNNLLSSPSAIESLCHIIQQSNALQKLSLYGNKLSGATFSSILQILATSGIQVLDAGSNNIFAQAVTNWECLKHNTALHSLLLSENPLGWDKRHFNVDDLSPVFGSLSSALTSLDISFCDINNDHVKQLCDAITINGLSLQHLNLSSNFLKLSSTQTLAILLSVNTQIQSLDLSFNELLDVGVIALVESIQNLRYLGLARTQLTDKGVRVLMDYLLTHPNTLAELNLEMNSITEGMAAELCHGLSNVRIQLALSHIESAAVANGWNRRG